MATKTRKQTKPATPAESTNGNGNGHAGTSPTAADLRGRITTLRVAIDKLDPWDREKLDKKNHEVADLVGQLEVAELQEMPLPLAAAMKFQERDILVNTIRQTGNHREADDAAETIRLARSIGSLGLQQRIGVRAIGDGSFELIWGSRRLAASILNKSEEIPAKVFSSSLTQADVEILRTIENFGRKELTPVERAIAVARILDKIEDALNGQEADAPFNQAIDAAGGLHEYVGRQLGFPARWVKDHAYVAQLGGKARALLAAHRIGVEAARELAKLGDRDAADRVAMEVARNEQGLGGRDMDYLKRRVVEHLRSLRGVPWRMEVAFGHGKPGCTGHACTTCPHNSKSDPDLFGGAIADQPEAGTCTNEGCFKAKQEICEKDLEKSVKAIAVQVKRDKEFAITETTIAGSVPVHVRPASAARRAKKELEPKAEQKTPAGSDRGASHQTPEQQAKAKLRVAVDEWRDKAEAAIIKGLTPKRWGMLALASCFPRFNFRYPFDSKKQGDILDMIHSENSHGMAEAAARAIKKIKSHWDWNLPIMADSANEFLAFVARCWAPEVAEMPTLADFLPKPAAEPSSDSPWIDLMEECKTADAARELFCQHETAIEQLQRGLGLVPTVGKVHDHLFVGFECVTLKAWTSAIAAARKIDPAAADTLDHLVKAGKTIHGSAWTKLLQQEGLEPRTPKKKTAKRAKPAEPTLGDDRVEQDDEGEEQDG